MQIFLSLIVTCIYSWTALFVHCLKIKPNYHIVAFLFMFLVLFPLKSYAGPPDCGAIDREDVLRDVYRDAGKLKFIIRDMRKNIDVLCSFMEPWEKWEEDDAREDVLDDDDDYQAAREFLIKRVLDDLAELKQSILLYRTWREVDPATDMQEAKQIAYMNKTYTYMSDLQNVVLSRGAEINGIMRWDIKEESP